MYNMCMTLKHLRERLDTLQGIIAKPDNEIEIIIDQKESDDKDEVVENEGRIAILYEA